MILDFCMGFLFALLVVLVIENEMCRSGYRICIFHAIENRRKAKGKG